MTVCWLNCVEGVSLETGLGPNGEKIIAVV